MAKLPINYRQPLNRPTAHFQPRRPRFRFRPALILVPLSLIFAAWVLNRIRPVIGWDDIMDLLGIRNRQRASMVIVLGLTLLAILLIKRILGKNRQ